MAEGKRVKVIGPNGETGITVPDYQLDQAMRQGYFPVDQLAEDKPGPSWVERTWDRYNKGLVSPNAFLKWASGSSKEPLTLESLEKMRDQPTSLKETPGEAFSRTFHSGVTADLARTASSLTSPASISTVGLSQAARATGAVGSIAKTLLTGQGLIYGAKGVGDVASGLLDEDKGYNTPQGLQQILSGGAQIAGAAPAVAQAVRGGSAALSRVMPGLLARDSRAFIGALRPPMKEIAATRDAYEDIRGDLQKVKPQDLSEMRDFLEKGRRAIAAETAGRIFQRNPTGGTIDPVPVGDAIRKRITPWMKLRATRSGKGGVVMPGATTTKLPPEGEYIRQEAETIENNLKQHPLNLVEAENIVQDINALLTKFRKLPPGAQYQALRSGDPVAVMTAVKESLQEQIDAQVDGYKDLKRRYGSYKELQNQTERRMNDIDRGSGQMDWTQRRGLENVGSTLGAIFSGEFLRGLTDIFAGRVVGDIAIESLRRPERLLQRSLKPPLRPLPFAGQVTQPVAAGLGGGGGEDVDKVLDQMFGAKQQ